MIRILLTIILAQIGLTAASQNDFSFIFYTDLHLKAEAIAQQGYEKCIAKMNTLNPDFVIDGGDFIFEMNHREWKDIEASYQLYSILQKTIKAPVYQVIGNHDALGVAFNVKRKVDKEILGKRLFKQTTGRRSYYSFDHKGWQFIALDCIQLRNGYGKRMAKYHISDEQLDWLTKNLDTIPKDKPIVLMAHVPFISALAMYNDGSRKRNSKSTVISNTKEVLNLLENHNLKLTLSGHIHKHEELLIEGTQFVNGGAVSGRWWKGSFKNTPNGFTKIDIVDGEAKVSYIGY